MSTKAPALRAFLRERFAAADQRSASKAEADTVEPLLNVIDSIAAGCAQTAVALRTTIVKKVQSTNEFGDDVLTADLVADKRVCEALAACDDVAAYASEEHPELTVLSRSSSSANDGKKQTRYTVTFDPLDGSSIIDTNFSVGSIFAVWAGATCLQQKVRDIVVSVVAVYGPRTTLFVAHKSFGVHEFMLVSDSGDWRLARRTPVKVDPSPKFFAPGNLRAANDIKEYQTFLKNCVKDNITLRYTGGMVPDVTQIFVKGSGVFATPTSPRYKVKLRVCFECGPLAHMMTCAGGTALDEEGVAYDEKVVTAMDQRSGIVLGSLNAVERLRGALVARPPSPAAPIAQKFSTPHSTFYATHLLPQQHGLYRYCPPQI